jgi:prophage regulatory protein
MSAQAERLLPLPAVLERTSHSRAGLYDAMNKGDFPKPVRISANRVAWPSSSIDAWIAAKMRAA